MCIRLLYPMYLMQIRKEVRMNSLQGLVAARVAELNITKQSLADAVGVSLVTFNKKVCGESDITITEARKLAKAIEVSSDEVCRLAP
jgi:plasmid maintenance system antidote protein VapI|nr:MAG TPA: Regulatory protein-modification, helix-turn-helix, transcriptional regulato, DNA [Caudoviricetes sp.]